jgi:pimeloyl-ACP methyl ester carboxylesterase
MSALEVPGACLYYETHGSGPLMILIPGAAGAREPYGFITASLTSRYTVLLYDRRGFSRSELRGEQDYDRRIEADADDVRRLIENVSDEPAIVFGGSSGAIVALEVLVNHPLSVRTVVAHEPPVVTELPDGEDWVRFFHYVYDVYKHSGPEPAMQLFRERAFGVTDQQIMTHIPTNEFSARNSAYWFEHELRQYPAIRLDLDALRAHRDRIALAAGLESRETVCHEATEALAGKLGVPVGELPGGHIGYVTNAAEFAAALQPCLATD